ncbi:MAG TPA: glycoside hydrolase family 97 catalytic domain-containing protein, partial [Opitutaceae bacterium]
MLRSPGGNVVATFSVSGDQRLVYTLTRAGAPVVETSPLGMTIDGVDLGAGVELGAAARSSRDMSYPWRGGKARAIDRANELALEIAHGASGLRWTLEARAYDDAFAFRYVVPGEGSRRVEGEATAWTLPAGTAAWYCPNTVHYEGEYERAALEEIPLIGPIRVAGEFQDVPRHLGFPVTLELPDGTLAALAEADVMGYSGMTLRPTRTTTLRAAFEDDAQGWTMQGTILSPWRIVMTGPDLNALVNCDAIHNVCPPPDPALFPAGFGTEWIKPGRALWQWWAYDNPGTHWSTQKAFVDQAARLGCEYYLVDEGWEHTRQEWFAPGETAWARMNELCDYAKSKGVAIWAWRAWQHNEQRQFPGLETDAKREDFFRRCAEVGIVGVKIDFMNSESHELLAFYEDCLRKAAQHRIMVDFHGANKPAGETRTWPHEMTREGVKGLEHNKWSTLSPRHYAVLPFTRYLAGHGDFTPLTLQPAFLKGTTATQQMATSVLYTSPFLCWADKPELYLDEPAVADFMRHVPTTWDETLVLPVSRLGEIA